MEGLGHYPYALIKLPYQYINTTRGLYSSPLLFIPFVPFFLLLPLSFHFRRYLKTISPKLADCVFFLILLSYVGWVLRGAYEELGSYLVRNSSSSAGKNTRRKILHGPRAILEHAFLWCHHKARRVAPTVLGETDLIPNVDLISWYFSTSYATSVIYFPTTKVKLFNGGELGWILSPNDALTIDSSDSSHPR